MSKINIPFRQASSHEFLIEGDAPNRAEDLVIIGFIKADITRMI